MGAAPILTIFRNGEKVDERAIDGEGVLGRGEGCVVRLEDRAISRAHAILRPIESGLQIEKKSEFAPISVNGAEVTRALLKESDIVAVGPFIVKVSYPKSEEPAAPVAEPLPAMDELAAPASPSLASSPSQSPSTDFLAAPAVTQATVALDSPDLQVSLAPPESGEGLTPLNPSPEHASFGGQSLAIEGTGESSAPTAVLSHAAVVVRIVVGPSTSEPVEYEMNVDEVVIGRIRDCQVIVRDKKSSRRHAKIVKQGKKYILQDLDTVNGTYLNGEKITQAELSGDDMIQIGDTEIKFQVVSPELQNQAEAVSTSSGEATSIQDQVNDAVPAIGEPGPAELAVDQGIHGSPLGGTYPEPVTPMPQPPAGQQPFDMAASLPLAGGLAGSAPVPGKKKTIQEWFRAQPKKRQVVLAIIFIGLMTLLMVDLPEEGATPQPAQPAAGGTAGQPGQTTYERLSPDQKVFVDTTYTLALDLFKGREFDKALVELRKVFAILPDYKEGRTIERLAQEGKRRLEVDAEERAKKEEAERVKARVAQLTEQGQAFMGEKKFDQVQQIMNDILQLDPENPAVAKWKAEIDEDAARRQVDAANQERMKLASTDAWRVLSQAKRLQKQEKFYPAITQFQRAIEIAPYNRGLVAQAKAGIRASREAIQEKVEPLIEEAKREEEAGKPAAAYKLFRKASLIDPYSKDANRGMERVREALNLQAKQIYAEAVIAEGYSDFETAQKRFKECLEVAPEDNIYHERSLSRLKRYQPYGRLQETQP